MKKHIKLCILTVGTYPVPATEGGAVENLVEMMLHDYQRAEYDVSVDVISKYSPAACEKAEKLYGKTKFHFVKYSERAKGVYKLVKRVTNKLFNYIPNKLDPYFSKALKIIKKNNYDAVIVENALYYVEPLKKYCKSKIVFHLHNDFDLWHNYALCLKLSDMLISVSDFVANTVRNADGCDFPVVTVKNVIDTKRFADDEQKRKEAKAIREKYGISGDDVLCVFVGRLVPEKGIDLLLDALAKIDDERIKLLIVGGTAFADSMTTEFETLLFKKAKALGNRVAFTGFVDYNSIPSYYYAADIFVAPSQWEEAAGLVVIEAQSASLPVIVTRSGGMPEYVSEQSALIIDRGEGFADRLAEAIKHLGESRELREKMGNAGAEFASKYDKCGYFDAILDAVVNTLEL